MAVLVKGGATLAALVSLFVIGITATKGLPGTSHYELRAEFEDLSNLTQTGEVRMFGKRIGRVLNLDTEGGAAVVDLQLDDDLARLPADTKVRVRSRSLLSDRYLDVTPGSSRRRLEDGDMIPASQTSASVEFGDLLDAFDKPTRTGLKSFIDEFGRGFLGRGTDLNAALRDIPALLRNQRGVADEILAREGAAGRFFPSIESAAAAADPVREHIARGFEPQARSLRPLAERRPAVQDLLEEASRSFPAVRSALVRSDPLLRETTRFARATTAVMRPAPAAMRESAALFRESREPLRRAESALRQAAAVTPAVLRLTAVTDPIIPRSRSTLQDALPWLRTLHEYECDAIRYWSMWRSGVGYGSPGGKPEVGGWLTVFRLKYDTAGVESVGGQGTSELEDPSIRSQAYPAPCTGGTGSRQP